MVAVLSFGEITACEIIDVASMHSNKDDTSPKQYIYYSCDTLDLAPTQMIRSRPVIYLDIQGAL